MWMIPDHGLRIGSKSAKFLTTQKTRRNKYITHQKKKEREKKLQLWKKNHSVEEEACSSSGFMVYVGIEEEACSSRRRIDSVFFGGELLSSTCKTVNMTWLNSGVC